ncbi:GNAT family N-acetyltransferase [Allosphingosinicella flava]|uniref:GNAT family N-acetyltransferase n=1 Tax=Allosphingosinicella flava TaxID=2771430 RepID=A0A7T2GJL6_9SPHN|nr:GNAT family N-acetyltransferase [Sphingosinicella flava]QPQ55077.1 GNAT family N-acetyltransferase [Sphingosinicella flava]
MFARTDRLLLRPGWAEDAPALAAAIGDEAIIRNLASAPWPYHLTDAEAFLRAQRDMRLPAFLVTRRTTGAPELIGSVGLGATPDGDIELGYWIARAHWGRGYATEAAAAVVEIARDGLRLKRLVASHFVDNPASGRVLEKLGFETTGDVACRFSKGRGQAAPAKLFDRTFRPAPTLMQTEEMIAA